MKVLKKAWLPVFLLAGLGLSLGAVNPGWAQVGGWSCMNANVTPEQSAQLFDLRQQFLNGTAGGQWHISTNPCSSYFN